MFPVPLIPKIGEEGQSIQQRATRFTCGGEFASKQNNVKLRTAWLLMATQKPSLLGRATCRLASNVRSIIRDNRGDRDRGEKKGAHGARQVTIAETRVSKKFKAR
jgi:hypothetical protein